MPEALAVGVFFRWLFILGFFFLLGAVMWAIIQIERMKRQRAVDSLMSKTLQARKGFKEAIDKIQTDIDLDKKDES